MANDLLIRSGASAMNVEAAHKINATLIWRRRSCAGLSRTPGSYVSESNYFNGSWQEAYWGANYPRLRGIKRKYDPDGRSLSTTASAVKNGVLTDSRD